MHIHFCLLAGLFLTLTDSTPFQPSAKKTHNKLLLISVDGFRWDYDQYIETPNLQMLVKEGVKAKYISPSFITMTSPSHFTLLTGRDIESHGVIHNMWFNTTTGQKKPYYATQGVNEWWDTGSLPIWITAQRQGLKAGSIHFPGTKPSYDGEEIFLKMVEPRFYNYSNETAWRENIDTVMKWFTVDDLDFVTFYIGEPDSAGHKNGPDSEKLRNAVRQVDRTIGYLVQSIEKHGLKSSLNVIITADHGMTTVHKEPIVEEIVLKRIANFSFKDIDFELLDYGPIGMLLPKEGKIEKVYQALKGAHPHMKVYKKEDLPERLRYSKHERILPILLFGDLGYVVHGRMKLQNNKGEHGFDNQYMDMKMIFRAFGPDFKKNYLSEPFDSVNIYPLMCNLLQITPEPHNGSLEMTRGMLNFAGNKNFQSSAMSQGLVGLAAVAVFLTLVAAIATGSSLYRRSKDRRTHNENPSHDGNMTSTTGF